MIRKSILTLSAGLLAMSSVNAQSLVKTNGKKYVLLEEATGTWCGYCPDGAQNIEETIEPHFPQCIVASFHGPNGYGEPMMITGDPFCTGGSFSTSFPYGCVDRNSFGGKQGLSRAWDNYVKTDTALAPNFDVIMKSAYDAASRKLTIEVTAKCLVAGTGLWNMNVYVLEDSIPSSGANKQHSYAGAPSGNTYSTSCTGSAPWYLPWPTATSGDLDASIYAHMNVVRAVLAGSVTPTWSGAKTSNAWGDTALVDPTVGKSFARTYTYTIPAAYNPYEMKVIGLVQKYDKTTKTNCVIENAIESKVRMMGTNAVLGTTTVDPLNELSIFPNPAEKFISVKCFLDNTDASSVTILNAAGQVAVQKQFTNSGTLFAERISLDGLSSGIYFLTFTNNGNSATRQFIIK